MRAVWSFWSKPHNRSRHYYWSSEFHHALAWSLSVQEARKHYPDTWLYTDDAGARLLVDKLRLPFTHVRTGLNALDGCDPGWWALGKLYAYSQQTEPFVHLDYDVFLWLPLPERLTRADVFAQNPEPFALGTFFYVPEQVERALAGVNGWLPDEWTWYRASQRALRGECCGVVGGNRVDFIRHAANLAFKILEHPANRVAMTTLDNKDLVMIVLEQFLLAACLEYHGIRPGSPFHGVTIAYLFDSFADAFNPDKVAAAGYTHLLGDNKRNPAVARLLEERVRRDDPAQFERCKRVGGALMAT